MSLPLLLAFCDDLFFLPRIEDAAKALGFRFKAINAKEDLGIEGGSIRRNIHLTEPLQGPDFVLLQFLVDDRPALIILDTANQSLPWQNWIHVIKTSAATRRIPIIAFGAHVKKETLQQASEAGADLTISRGRLQSSLADIISEWASVPDVDAIRSACNAVLSDLAQEGIALIKGGKYYEAHELLERAWQKAVGAEAYLLRALLQVSVSYHHIEKGNLRGAMKMLLRVKQWLEPLPAECNGVDVDALRGSIMELRTALEETKLEGVPDNFVRFLMPIPMTQR